MKTERYSHFFCDVDPDIRNTYVSASADCQIGRAFPSSIISSYYHWRVFGPFKLPATCTKWAQLKERHFIITQCSVY